VISVAPLAPPKVEVHWADARHGTLASKKKRNNARQKKTNKTKHSSASRQLQRTPSPQTVNFFAPQAPPFFGFSGSLARRLFKFFFVFLFSDLDL
jgi:hypothetical protein